MAVGREVIFILYARQGWRPDTGHKTDSGKPATDKQLLLPSHHSDKPSSAARTTHLITGWMD